MPETHTTVRNGKRLLWYTEGLWKKAEQLVPFEVEVAGVEELDENCWFGSRAPTIREVLATLNGFKRLTSPIRLFLTTTGSLMDGRHRLCKAILEGHSKIKAVQFSSTPTPDEISDIHAS